MSFVPERLDASVRKRLEWAFCGCVAILVLAGLLAPAPTPALAGIPAALINWVLVLIASILGWVIQFVGRMVLFVVAAVISVAQYNSFTTALPVESGWPLVRDVVNMLFIVVLLITAFSTIIQYKKFDYRKILPKLLLMAVLVNFSKLLIGLLIDFSQVLMLTFVNGFKAASGGNFMDAFHLTKVLNIVKRQSEEGGLRSITQNPVLIEIVVAEMLALFMTVITLSMMLIILIYLIARVVGLWIALIISPLAFFMTALDNTPLSSKIAGFSKDFWQKLGAMTSGGPVMAFFLWLTLATVQGGGFGEIVEQRLSQGPEPVAVAMGLIPVAQAQLAENNPALQFFGTEAGSLEALATFFVAIVMLGMGVNIAVQTAGAFSEGAGKLAGQTRDMGSRAAHLLAHRWATVPAARVARATPRAVLQGAAYVGGATAGAVATRADARWDITGRAGARIQQVGRAVGSTAVAAYGGQLRGRRDEQMAAYEKTIEAETKGMDEEQKLAALNKEARSGNRDRQKAGQLARAKFITSKSAQKMLAGRYEAEGKERGLEGAELKAYAEGRTRELTGERLAELKKLADTTGSKELQDFYKEKTEKRLDWIADDEEFKKKVNELIDKGPTAFNNAVDPDSFGDARLLNALASKTDLLNDKGEIARDGEWGKRLVKGGGTRAQTVEQYVGQLRAAAAGGGGTEMKRVAEQGTVSGSVAKPAGGSPTFVSQQTLAAAAARAPNEPQYQAAAAARAQRSRVLRRDQAAVNAAHQQIDTARASTAPTAVTDRRDAQYAAMLAGAGLKEAYDVDDHGMFKDDTDRQNYRQNVELAMSRGSAAPGLYAQLDLEAMSQNIHGKNESRQIFAGSADLTEMTIAHRAAQAAGNEEARAQIASAISLVHEEGSRVEALMNQYNTTADPSKQVSLDAVKNAATANDQAALAQAIRNMGGQITMDEAKAYAKKRQIDLSPALDSLRSHASSHAAAAVRHAAATTAAPPRVTP